MKERILYFVAGEYPTPEETAEILKLAEAAKDDEGKPLPGAPHVEVMSVQKMPADHVADLSGVTTLAGSVPTNYTDAFRDETGTDALHRTLPKHKPPEGSEGPAGSQGPTSQADPLVGRDAAEWTASETAKLPDIRKAKR